MSAAGWDKVSDTEAAAMCAEIRAEVLAEAADAIVAENDRMLWASTPGQHWAADLLRRMADPTKAARMQDATDTLAAQREQPDRIADSEILRAAPDSSDDWSDEVWAAWHRVAERAHASRPPLKSRLALLLAHVQEHGGEWTTRRVQKVYGAEGQVSPLRTTARKDLHALHAMGWLVLDTTDPGRRVYRLNHAHGGTR